MSIQRFLKDLVGIADHSVLKPYVHSDQIQGSGERIRPGKIIEAELGFLLPASFPALVHKGITEDPAQSFIIVFFKGFHQNFVSRPPPGTIFWDAVINMAYSYTNAAVSRLPI